MQLAVEKSAHISRIVKNLKFDSIGQPERATVKIGCRIVKSTLAVKLTSIGASCLKFLGTAQKKM